jgi:hypothetical protein
MFYRLSSLTTLAGAIFFAAIALAAHDDNDYTQDGRIVSVSKENLMMKNKEGRQYSYALSADTQLSCDGNVCKKSDLKAGLKIRVTPTKADPKVAIEVEAIDKNPLFANMYEGKFVSISDNKLVMTNKEGQEYSPLLADDAKVTCDAKACKASDLQPGMAVRVTTMKNDKNAVIRIEAIDKNAEFPPM